MHIWANILKYAYKPMQRTVMILLRSYKTEIDPTDEQKFKIKQTIGTCRFVYNFFIIHNKELHASGEKFISGKIFSVWLNNEFIPGNENYAWIKDVSSKSVKKAIEDADTAFRKFFKGQAGFPRFKKKRRSDVKMYFVRNNPGGCRCERHRIKIPTLGWVRLKEKGYIPASLAIRSGTVSVRTGRYYVSVLVDVPDMLKESCEGEPLGIDLGIKELAVLSDGRIYPNINKTPRVRKLERKLRREQRKLSRRYEAAKTAKPPKKANINRQRLKVQKLYQRLDNIRKDHVNKMVSGIVKTKPSYIAIEDLNVSGTMKNRYLARAIASQCLHGARLKLTRKCKAQGTEVRIVYRFYPSSKTCHACGHVKKDLKLSERVYRCRVCGFMENRDLNASLNLRDTTEYRTA